LEPEEDVVTCVKGAYSKKTEPEIREYLSIRILAGGRGRSTVLPV
jgi:hypothetical protein